MDLETRQREGRRSRRREKRREVSADTKARSQQAYRHLRNPYAPVAQLSDDQIEAIHEASLTILEDIGIRVLLPEAREIYKAAGADVEKSSQIVKLDRALVMDTIARAPETLTLYTRNPERTVDIGGDAVGFTTVGGAPNVTDLENGRRPGSFADFCNFMRLAQTYDVIHMLGPATEPQEIDARFRGLDMTHAQLTLSDKAPFVYSRGRESVADGFEMIRIANNVNEEDFTKRIYCKTVVNMNSPLQLDVSMALGIIDFARSGQLMVLTPFTLAGAMAPVSVAGALTQQNAEALGGIALSQMTKPGAPVAYGAFTSNVDMRSGAPAFGTPEYAKAAFASGQLARRYKLPLRSSNVNASNAPDAQAAYESQMAIWSALLGGAHILNHGAGWLEGGLTASFEKFIIDIEMLQMFAELFKPLSTSESDLGLDAIREVGHGGHFFGAAHTLERYQEAFYEPLVSDWQNHGAWLEAGGQDAATRAHHIWKQALSEFEPPPLDESIREALDAYVERRKAEGGAAPPE
jgi:trimethylamine--corrinoid protein Co-methyltransferase